VPSPDLHINPDLTMGENMADAGGVVIALGRCQIHESWTQRFAPAPESPPASATSLQ
jgi:predicted metalloendopeptidase